MAAATGFSTVSVALENGPVSVINRGHQAKCRNPDAISGGAWEVLERVLQKYRYHEGGLVKTVAATEIAQHMNVNDNRSRSFQVFKDGVRRLVAGGSDAAES